jgi:hypothetical protein
MATKAELMEQAAALDIEGRSSMSKDELEQAVKDAGGQVDQPVSQRPTGLAYREGR